MNDRSKAQSEQKDLMKTLSIADIDDLGPLTDIRWFSNPIMFGAEIRLMVATMKDVSVSTTLEADEIPPP